MPRDFAAIRIEYGCNGGCDVTAALAAEVFDEDGDEKPAKGWALCHGSKLSQKLASIETEELIKKIKELAKGDNKDASDKLLEALKTQGAAQVTSSMEENWQTIFPKKEEKPATAGVVLVLTRGRCVGLEDCGRQRVRYSDPPPRPHRYQSHRGTEPNRRPRILHEARSPGALPSSRGVAPCAPCPDTQPVENVQTRKGGAVRGPEA